MFVADNEKTEEQSPGQKLATAVVYRALNDAAGNLQFMSKVVLTAEGIKNEQDRALDFCLGCAFTARENNYSLFWFNAAGLVRPDSVADIHNLIKLLDEREKPSKKKEGYRKGAQIEYV